MFGFFSLCVSFRSHVHRPITYALSPTPLPLLTHLTTFHTPHITPHPSPLPLTPTPYTGTSHSLVGSFGAVGKLAVLLIMLLGKHRALPQPKDAVIDFRFNRLRRRVVASIASLVHTSLFFSLSFYLYLYLCRKHYLDIWLYTYKPSTYIYTSDTANTKNIPN